MATSQSPPAVQTAFMFGGGTGTHAGQAVCGAHSAALSSLCPETLTAVHSPVEPHSQHPRPLRRRHSSLLAHFENSGAMRVSNAWQRVPTHRAPMYGLLTVGQRGHEMGTGQVAARNASMDLPLTPAKFGSSGIPQGAQQPVSAATH
jgi:hypothetical protein